MSRLDLILIYVLHFEAVVIGGKLIYKRAGEDAALPCAICHRTRPLGTYPRWTRPLGTRPLVSWLYSRDGNHSLSEVEGGNVTVSSPRAARLSLDPQCSLLISGVTADDAGRYTCGRGQRTGEDVYLIVLTISPSPADAEPNGDEVALSCSLRRHSDLRPCRRGSLRWADESGAELPDEGAGHRVLGQTSCVSVLAVKRQGGLLGRKFTCRFVDMDGVETEAEYTPDSTGVTPLSCVMWALRGGGLILMIVITAVFIRSRWNSKPLDDYDDVGIEVQYENVEAASAAARL